MLERRRQQRGITLLEVLTATALTAIVTAVAVPNFRGLGAPYALVSTAQLVASDAHRARLGAIARNARERLRVDATAGTWVIEREQAPNSWVQVGEMRAVPSGATITKAPADPTFDSRGMLPANVTITVTDGTRTRTVTINVLGQATLG